MDGEMSRIFCENPLEIDLILEKILHHVSSPATLFKCRAINRFWNHKAFSKALLKLDEMSVILEGSLGDPTTSKMGRYLSYFCSKRDGYFLIFTNFTLKNIAIYHGLTEDFLGFVGLTIKTLVIDWNDFLCDKEQETPFIQRARGRAFEVMPRWRCRNLEKLILKSKSGSQNFQLSWIVDTPILNIKELEINYDPENASDEFGSNLFQACSRLERLHLGDKLPGDYLNLLISPELNTQWFFNLTELTIVTIIGEAEATLNSIAQLKLKRVKLNLRFSGEYQSLGRFLGSQRNTLESIDFTVHSHLENPNPRIAFPDPMPKLKRLHLEYQDGVEFTPINFPIVFPSLEKLSVLGVGTLWPNVRIWMETSKPHLGVTRAQFQSVYNKGRILLKRVFPNSKSNL